LEEFLDRFSGSFELAAIGVAARDAIREAAGILATIGVFHKAIGEWECFAQIPGPTYLWVGQMPHAYRALDHAHEQ